MMTESIFHANSYIKDFDAVVTAVDETTRAVVLDRTAFFPGGGGQLCDLGTLASAGEIWAVEKVRNGPGGIEHILAGESPLPTPGELATGKLDWGRRYRLMRTHTAMHILCGVIFRDFGAQVTGGDMDLKQGRMDFEFESMTRDLVEVIEASVNLEVEKNLPVRVKILQSYSLKRPGWGCSSTQVTVFKGMRRPLYQTGAPNFGEGKGEVNSVKGSFEK
jgi:misacylated tRNA(Ala) deacylase